ncbi:hypothetical protein G9A89_014949 [Geosiphon pyriformis]|nr:hypothetical protein G9A89_014949 [Geosiphon pyriformis]
MKKTVESSGSVGGFKAVLLRKKRRGGVFEDNTGAKKGSAKVQNGHSWSSETGDTTESDSVDIEKECLVEKTSFDYGEDGALVGGDLDQTLKDSKVLGKPLGKINFLDGNDNDDVFLDASLVLFPPLKNLVNVSVRKLFALDLDLKAVERNSAQEKLKKIRSLFSGINSFGGASIPSKFSEIIRATFTFELSLIKATKKATGVNIMNFIGSVGGKTCVINYHPITYARTRCAVICFDSAESLDAIVGTMPVLRGANLCWSCLILAKYAKCEKLGHTSLGCAVGGRVFSGLSSHRVLLNTDKSRLAAIYTKQSALVARPVSFSGLSWAKVANGSSFPSLSERNASVKFGSFSEMEPFLPVSMKVNDRFAALERSLASLAE